MARKKGSGFNMKFSGFKSTEESSTTTQPTEAELIAQAEARFGEGVKVPQYSEEETQSGVRVQQRGRGFQSGTWGQESQASKKKYIEKGIKEDLQLDRKLKSLGMSNYDAYLKKLKTHRVVKGEWVKK